jgi:hypothetical protein
MSRPGKKIVCRVHVHDQARAVEFTWSEGSASFKPYALVDDQVVIFKQNIAEARSRLHDLVLLHEKPLEARDPVSYRQSCLELAQAGNRLHSNVFDRGARGEQVTSIRDWLRGRTASGQVESLEVVCYGRPWFAPWNLLYDKPPVSSDFALPADGAVAPGFEPFWGVRYNLCGGQTVDPLRRVPFPPAPDLLVVVDPFVHDDLGHYPKPGGSPHGDRLNWFLAARGLKPVKSREELEQALAERRPHVIY